MRVAINGAGRIGRATLRNLLDQPELELVAVNDIASTGDIAYLVKNDSIYGRLNRPVEAADGSLRIGDEEIRVFNTKQPSDIPWKDADVDLVFECTGVFRKTPDLRGHLDAGAPRVILSAPPKDDQTPNVVPGVNASTIADQKVVSCASCTTNCVAPVLDILHRRFGIRDAFFTTTHAYTASQGLVDAPAKKRRRGRAAAMNLIPTTTGADEAVTDIIPDLDGRVSGVAVRAPVPVGSITDIVARCENRTDPEKLNNIFVEESRSSNLRGILGVSDEELVSSDIVGDPRAAIVDLTSTSVMSGDLVKVFAWYDNEWGYAAQLVRLARTMLNLETEELDRAGEPAVVTGRA